MTPILIFDMDGVLAEVTDSYRETITQTVLHFTGTTVRNDLIQQYKNAGGWNNDWALSQQICRDLGTEVPYEAVIERFNQLFLGDNFNGLILREKWTPKNGLLERLALKHELAIFTGRPLEDLNHTLSRFAPSINFDPIITMESVTLPKPDPEGLNLIKARRPNAALTYLGDTIDDARSAAAAHVPFIGIAANETTARLLRNEGAIAVIPDINQLEGVLK